MFVGMKRHFVSKTLRASTELHGRDFVYIKSFEGIAARFVDGSVISSRLPQPQPPPREHIPTDCEADVGACDVLGPGAGRAAS